jgi:hypothetical protein
VTTEPKERPILFSGPMVRAILGGRKTQTRRVVKPQEHAEQWPACGCASPYGRPGDRLWVRETWAPKQFEDGVNYRASGDLLDTGHCRWKPSIHMPRRASRILLEVTDVRVERLQRITGYDAMAEGIEGVTNDLGPGATVTTFRDYETDAWDRAAYQSFRSLWRSINGPDSWDADPWVWVVSFKRVEPST